MVTVGVIGPIYPDSFAENIACGLEDLGHRAVLLGGSQPAFLSRSPLLGQAGELALRANRMRVLAQRSLLDKARAQPLDAIIVIDQGVAPETVDALGAVVRPLCFWFPDHVENLGRQTMFQGSYDAIFSKEPRLVRQLCDVVGLPAHYLPEACNPRWHRIPSEPVEPDPHVIVMGNYYPYRVRLLERLARAGIPLRLYGTPLPRWLPSPTLEPLHTGTYATRDDKAKILRAAAAVLNPVFPYEIDGLNCRLFEATGCGACVVTEHRAELPNMFVPGEEVLAFEDFDELVDHVKWCLANPDEAQRIGDRASARSHRDHTYAHRLADLLTTVGLDAGLAPSAD